MSDYLKIKHINPNSQYPTGGTKVIYNGTSYVVSNGVTGMTGPTGGTGPTGPARETMYGRVAAFGLLAW